MRVLVLSHLYPSTFNSSSGIFVHEQVKELVKKGHEVRVISPVPLAPFPLNKLSDKWRGYSRVPQKACIEGINVYYPRKITIPMAIMMHASGKLYYKSIRGLIKKLYLEFPFDIIHCHTALPDGYAGMLLKQTYNIPLVTTIHGQDFQLTIYKNSKCKDAVCKVVKACDKVITVSKKLERTGKTICDNENKYITISNGINPEQITSPQTTNQSSYSNKKIILSVGRLIDSKGHDIIIKAFKKIEKEFKDIHLIIIGDGTERQNITSLIYELGLESKIELLGQVSHEMVMEFMSLCDIFVLPSWNEGFGMVYIEAMAHSKPIIGCKGEGIEDIVVDGENGFLARPKSIDDLVAKLTRLLQDDRLRIQIGVKAKKTIIENYTWSNNVNKLENIYNNLLEYRI